MVRRLALSAFVAVVICGLSFYLASFAGLIYASAAGQLNSANTQAIQESLRDYALPVSLALGVISFVLSFWRSGRHPAKPETAHTGNAAGAS